MELKTDPFTSKLDSRLGQLIYQQTGLTLERNHLHAPGAEVVEVKPALQKESASEAIVPFKGADAEDKERKVKDNAYIFHRAFGSSFGIPVCEVSLSLP